MKPKDNATGPIGGEFKRAAGPEKSKSGQASQAKPFTIRLTEDERQKLVREAGKLSLSAHVRHQLVGEAVSPRNSREPSRKQHRPALKQIALGKALALLGCSDLFRSLDAIAKAAAAGALPVTSDLVEELHAACAHVRAMRIALMEALGVKADAEHDSGR